MIRRSPAATQKRHGPRKRDLALAALKGAGMGALLTMILVKIAA